MLRHLALRLVLIFKLRFGAIDRISLSLRRVDVHHLNLTLRMADRALLITLRSIDYFLTAIWSLVPLLQVAGVYDLFLISLQHVRRMRCDSTAASLLKAEAASF